MIDTGKTPVLDEGEQIILRFSPVACEPPINFDALIRGIIRTDDGESLSLGLQFVELDTNTEGRRCLQRLCELEGRYVEAAASR